MIKKNDITVIIPVHEMNDKVKVYLTEAVKSVPVDVLVKVIVPFEIKDNDFIVNKKQLIILPEEDNNTSFQHMVNYGVKAVTTNWFSILEYDDEFSPIWFDNFIKYQKYNQEYNIFLPLNDLYNVENGVDEFVGNGNEAPWASSFSDIIGVIDEKALEDYFDFYLNGAIINKKTWDIVGGLKESIKLTFWYEFMLRAAHKGEKMYVIPKVGYAHVLGREGSLMMQYRSEMTTDESDFYFKLAKKESYFDEDRQKVYQPKELEDDELTDEESEN